MSTWVRFEEISCGTRESKVRVDVTTKQQNDDTRGRRTHQRPYSGRVDAVPSVARAVAPTSFCGRASRRR
eukprot:CAMPEP_0119531038 /NCGR_PEP_ID=MMETSP1344-20130328/44794_1 /TAXON_ID=236787 /ORGANISM="Florenciella parvula, Strain CCMP2471" /LENGTH=69 /DNA_ID=CAMNT_0007571177 /DNA_START=26 /DNA_END=231 /DNA_ORIENTATION=+